MRHGEEPGDADPGLARLLSLLMVLPVGVGAKPTKATGHRSASLGWA